MFYNSYIRLYLSEKLSARQDVTIEYINNIIERQTLEDIDTIFSDVEFELFELLDIGEGRISLGDPENVNIVVDFLVKSGVSPKFIEEVIPENNLEKVLELLKDPNSAETRFIKRLFTGLVVTNILMLLLIAGGILYLTKRIIYPIKRATSEIKTLEIGTRSKKIEYSKKDEIGLLIDSINGLNTRLGVQEKIRSRLLADISHELKTPITSIQCYLEGISDGVIELSEKNLNSITSEMSRLIGLVNQIMEFEKFENQELRVTKKNLNPYNIISRIVETQKISLEEKNQTVVITGSKNIELLFDEDLFKQVIYNILGNFQKYSGNATTLTIAISGNMLTFSDNGNGIAKKEIPLLFEKFYQGRSEKTGDSAIRGIGVGLSVVKKITEAHGWKIEVNSGIKKGFSLSIIIN
ncbi:HAMP domain-containing histidine kinase [Candidatus Gracilibacteria bacterium]|nr:HAMP domain-containing histidine kinase [Candidatus Gracilibacteria bacterium]